MGIQTKVVSIIAVNVFCVIASEKPVWFESILQGSDERGVTLTKVFENWSHLSECGALSDAIKSLDKYACRKDEVVLAYF